MTRTSSSTTSILLLIEKLSAATGPDSDLDKIMAKMLGWKLTEESYPDADGNAKKRALWLVPSGNDTGNPPKCTTHVNDAYKLMLQLAPNGVGACVCRSDGSATAQMEGKPAYVGANPAIAISLAALSALI
jgi:hypothetical protein